MTIDRFRARGGFVLPLALALTGVTAVALAVTLGYVSNGARQTRIALARSRCRLAAQSAIERVKARVRDGFATYTSGASVKVGPYSSTAYNWFDAVSSDRRIVGLGLPGAVEVDSGEGSDVDGCRVYCAVGPSVDHASGASIARVPLVATARIACPGGPTVTSTIQEYVCFATGQSEVFNYAYFVNNYGWMSGSGITINGDMRANGNVSLSGSVVNGFVYAAANDEVGANGKVTLSSSPKIWAQSYYRSRAGAMARPDKADYDVPGAFDAPSGSSYATIRRTTASGSGRLLVNDNFLPDGSTPKAEGDRVKPVAMPFVSDLAEYEEFARRQNGTLTYPGYSYADSLGNARTVPGGVVNARYSGAGPSGDPAMADNGALVLVGTRANPIRLNGPVVVDSDVIIKGYVTGQGTIYSGRNVHVIGSVQYLNPPSWDSRSSTNSDDARLAEENDAKDRLGLVAKGNIVMGDCSQDSWHSSVDSYVDGGSSSVVASYACDPSDADIGYPATFGGNYLAQEQTGSKLKVRKVVETLDTTHPETQYTYDWFGRVTGSRTVQVRDVVSRLESVPDRRYYETVCDDAVLASLKDASGIGRVDAVLYNNHGIFGTIGSGSGAFQLNGAIVCRDEGLIATAGNGITFNWDFRLMESPDPATLGLPVGPQEPSVAHWQEVPDSLNAVYVAATGGAVP